MQAPIPRKSSEARQLEIVEAALALLSEAGPGGTTTTAIAQRLGVSQAAIFKHFSSKEALLHAAVEAIGQKIGPRIYAAAQGERPPRARARAVLHAHVSTVKEVPAMAALLFYRETHSESLPLRQLLTERFDRLYAVFISIFENAEGSLNPAVAPADAADALVAIAQSVIVRWHLNRDLNLTGEADRLLELAWNGIGARDSQS